MQLYFTLHTYKDHDIMASKDVFSLSIYKRETPSLLNEHLRDSLAMRCIWLETALNTFHYRVQALSSSLFKELERFRLDIA